MPNPTPKQTPKQTENQTPKQTPQPPHITNTKSNTKAKPKPKQSSTDISRKKFYDGKKTTFKRSNAKSRAKDIEGRVTKQTAATKKKQKSAGEK